MNKIYLHIIILVLDHNPLWANGGQPQNYPQNAAPGAPMNYPGANPGFYGPNPYPPPPQSQQYQPPSSQATYNIFFMY